MSTIGEVTHIDNVKLSEDGRSVVIIDQTKLPNSTEYLTLTSAGDIYDAIFELKVRGAPAIGICAGYGLYCLARSLEAERPGSSWPSWRSTRIISTLPGPRPST
jgi:methylthioribose-1-phosphate isomerase